LLTPIAKAWCTDLGVEVSSLGVQVHGGMGFVEEGGAAQFYRDARIAPIYEGTNGIQAIDLYGRKLLGDRGEAMGRFIDEARKRGGIFAKPAEALQEATDYLLSAARNDALAGATAYLSMAGDVIGALLLARGLDRDRDPERKAVFDFYAATVLARAPSRLAEVRVGADALFNAAITDFAN
jgi:3-(methylthio)propanoyl-CoA dehydrogenase